MNKLWLYPMLLGCLILCLLGCADQKKSTKIVQKTYVVHPESLHKTLYFTGIIQPLEENTLTNPIDSVIAKMHYRYGQKVEKDAIVFTLHSSELEKQYNDILTNYLKAKDTFNLAQTRFVGTQDLWKEGLISKNTYLSELSNFNNARVTLMQATRKLTDMLETMGQSNDEAISSLSFSHFDKVRAALNGKHHLVYIKAPHEGVLLYPPKSTEDKVKPVSVGMSLKSGQVLGLIGNLNGVRVEIDVPEVDIDKIKPGMAVVIRNVVFPQDPIKGRLVAVNAQAVNNASSALPSFTALVEAKALTTAQKKWVKVGMSATVEVPIDNKDKLLIPIAAVKLDHGESIVYVKSKQGEIRRKSVSTGPALADKVVINKGLHTGDVVVYG